MKKIFKKLISIFLGTILTFSSSFSSMAAMFDIPDFRFEESLPSSLPWDGCISDKLDGEGTQVNPYLIKNAGDLALVAKNTRNGEEYEGKFLKFTNNIDFGLKTKWDPIGTDSHPFRGIIFGQNAILKNLIVEDVEGKDVSLFGKVCDAKVYDLIISNTVKLSSVGKSPVKYENRYWISKQPKELKNIFSSTDSFSIDSVADDNQYNNSYKNNSDIYGEEDDSCKIKVTYKVLEGTVGESGLDSSSADVKILTQNNESKYAHINMNTSCGGNVGIFGEVCGNSEICGIKNASTLESFGGSFDLPGLHNQVDKYKIIAMKVTFNGSKKSIGFPSSFENYFYDNDIYGTKVLSNKEYLKLEEMKLGSGNIDQDEMFERINNNIQTFKDNCRCILKDENGEENYICSINDSKILSTRGIGGQGGIVGIVAKTKSNSEITIKNCINYGEVTSCGGSSGRSGLKGSEHYINCGDIGGDGGYAGGLIGESESSLRIIDCGNYGHISSNGGGSKSTINIENVFESKGGKGGSAGGFIGCASESEVFSTPNEAVFEGNCFNSGKIEAISGDNPESTGGSTGDRGLSRGTGRRSTGLYNGSDGNGGTAGGFVGESYIKICLLSKSGNNGTVNTCGSLGGEKNFEGNLFGGKGGRSGGIIGYSSEDIVISNETRNDGDILANGGETGSDLTNGKVESGSGGIAGGIVGLSEGKVDLKAASSNSGRVLAMGGRRFSNKAIAGVGGIVGAVIGSAKSDIIIDGFVNESSGLLDASGRVGEHEEDKGKAGVLGSSLGNVRIYNTINSGQIRSNGNDEGFGGGEAGFLSNISGDIEVINCQNLGNIYADKGGKAGFITRTEPDKKVTVLNSSSIGDISATDGYGGFISKSSGEVSITNTYSASNINAGQVGKFIADVEKGDVTVKDFYVNKDKNNLFGNFSNNNLSKPLLDEIIEKEPSSMKEEEFAKVLNTNAIEVNKNRLKPDIFCCGWILEEDKVMICPNEFPDVAIEVFSLKNLKDEIQELKEKRSEMCSHNLTDEDNSLSTNKGTGTFEDPYIIDTSSELKNINCLESSGKFYKLTHNLTKQQSYKIGSSSQPFRGTILGNGAIIKNITDPLFENIEGAEIKDLLFDSSCVIDGKSGNSYNDGDQAIIRNATGNNSFINIENEAKVVCRMGMKGSRDVDINTSADVGGIVANASGEGTLSFIGCVNCADIFTTGSSTGPAGDAGGLVGNATCRVCLLDCKNEGKVISCGKGIDGNTAGVNSVFDSSIGKSGNAGGFIGAVDGNNGVNISGECINKGDIKSSSVLSLGTTGGFTGLSTAYSGMSTGIGANGGNAGGFIGYCESDVTIEEESNCKNYGRVISDGGIGGSTGLTAAFDKIYYSDYHQSYGGDGGNAGGLVGSCLGTLRILSNFANYSDISANGGSGCKYGKFRHSEGNIINTGFGGKAGNAGGVAGNVSSISSSCRVENSGSVSANGGSGGSPSWSIDIYKIVDEDGNQVKSDDGKYLWQYENAILTTDTEDFSTDTLKNMNPYVMFKGDLVLRGTINYPDSYKDYVTNDGIERKVEKDDTLGRSDHDALRTIMVGGKEIYFDEGILKQGDVFSRNSGRGDPNHAGTILVVDDRAKLTRFNKKVKGSGDSTGKEFEVFGSLNKELPIFLISGFGFDYITAIPSGFFLSNSKLALEHLSVCFIERSLNVQDAVVYNGQVNNDTPYYFSKDSEKYSITFTNSNKKVTLNKLDGTSVGTGEIVKRGSGYWRDPIYYEWTWSNNSIKEILNSETILLWDNDSDVDESMKNMYSQFIYERKGLYSPKYGRILDNDFTYCRYNGKEYTIALSENNILMEDKTSSNEADHEYVEFCFPIIGKNGELFRPEGNPIVYNDIPIRIGEGYQTLEYCNSPKAVYSKELAKTYKAEGIGGDGGNGGNAGSFIGKVLNGSIEINNFISHKNVKVCANAGIGGISSSEAEKTSEDGNGGHAGVIGESELSFVKINNLQCRGCTLSADGSDASVGVVGEAKGGETEIFNSLITGKFSAQNGYAGVIGKADGSLKIGNCYCAYDLESGNKGKVAGYLSDIESLSLNNLHFNLDVFKNTQVIGNVSDNALAGNLIANVHNDTDEQIKSIEVISSLNKNALCYNTERNKIKSRSLSDNYASGWIRVNGNSYPSMLKGDIDPSKMVRDKALIPEIEYITDSAIKLVDRESQEFSLDCMNQQDSSCFENLSAVSIYNVYAREKAGLNIASGEFSDPLKIRTIPTKIYNQIGKCKDWIIDSATGINFIFAKDSFVQGASMIVREVGKEDSNYTMVLKNTDDISNIEKIKYYEIKMVDSQGNEIQPKGYYAMLIPIPEDFDLTEKNLTGLCIKTGEDDVFDSDNNIIYIDGKPYYTLISNHFSDWAIADLDLEDEKISDSGFLETGDDYEVVRTWLLLIIFSGIIGYFAYEKKKKVK